MAGKRELIALECPECRQRNYTTTKNRARTPDKITKMKYCSCVNRHSLHRETKIK